jgi:hypothetical protein
MIGRPAGRCSHAGIGRDRDHSAVLRQYRRSWWLLAVLGCTLATIARAEVHVEGDLTAVRVTTSHDAISDVLSALAAALNVRYRTAIRLDAAANAAYSGSLGEVVARLLDGYSYVIKRNQETVEIVVIGRRGEVAVPAPRPPRAGRGE